MYMMTVYGGLVKHLSITAVRKNRMYNIIVFRCYQMKQLHIL